MIAIEDISMTEELDRKALTAARGGVAIISRSPWEDSFPRLPGFPTGFPFAFFPDLAAPEIDGRLQ